MEDYHMYTKLTLTSAILLALSGTVSAADTGVEADVDGGGVAAFAVVSTETDAGMGLESSAAEVDTSVTTGGRVKRPRTAHCYSTNAVQLACHCGHER